MSLIGILVASGNATTNPNPNTLTTVSPFPTPFTAPQAVSPAWIAQGKKALFPTAMLESVLSAPIPVSFIPSVSTATYTVTLWRFNRVAGVWIQPRDNASQTITGACYTEISDPGKDPLFLQLSAISSGTVAIYYDNGFGRVL
jgi:hypothetical protein